MKRMTPWLAALALATTASAALAGGNYKCTTSTQECLDKFTSKLTAGGWNGLDLKKSDYGKSLTIVALHPEARGGLVSRPQIDSIQPVSEERGELWDCSTA